MVEDVGEIAQREIPVALPQDGEARQVQGQRAVGAKQAKEVNQHCGSD